MHRFLWRPVIGPRPLVRTALEGERFGLVQLAFVFQIVSEERRFCLGAKIISGGIAEIDLPQVSSRPAPAAMVPWSKHDEVVFCFVEFFQGLISRQRAVIVFLIPPPADDQSGDWGGFQIISGAPGFPVLVVRWMRDKRVPGGELSGVQFGDLAERAF